MSTQTAYPLCWPAGWPRTQIPGDSKFGDRSVHAAMEELKRQLDMMRATDMLISSNVTLGATPRDKGICVYFKIKGKPYALPCDKWNAVEDNLWALAKHIEAIRGQERWGVGTIERAFAGYMALPAPAGTNPEEWWSVIKCAREATFEVVQAAYREQATICHPDRGGSTEAMMLVNAAFAAAKRSFGK